MANGTAKKRSSHAPTLGKCAQWYIRIPAFFCYSLAEKDFMRLRGIVTRKSTPGLRRGLRCAGPMQIQWWEGAVLRCAETVLQGRTHATLGTEIGRCPL
jgi:hypothetical protein